MRLLYLITAIAMPLLFIVGIQAALLENPTDLTKLFVAFSIFAGPILGALAGLAYLWKLRPQTDSEKVHVARNWLGWGLVILNFLMIYPIRHFLTSMF